MSPVERIVDREIYVCCSYLASDLSKLYWSSVSTLGEANQTAYPKHKKPDITFDEDEILELTNGENGEVFEHWAVSDWMTGKLREHGETVVEMCNLNLWCRTTTGQSISMDEVIQTIASEL